MTDFTILGGRKPPGNAWGMNACRKKDVDLSEKVLALRLCECYNERQLRETSVTG